MSRALLRIILVFAVFLTVTCKSSREPLPGLEAPPGLIPRVEALYIWAHYRPLIRSLRELDDIRFDKDFQFRYHHFWILIDIRRWHDQTNSGGAWLDQYLMKTLEDWTPDTRKFKGARERAVAVGLLAHSLYRQNPPEHEPTFAQLKACARGIRDHTCVLSLRVLVLKRMILLGQYANEALFDKLLAKARERRESGAPSQYTDGFKPRPKPTSNEAPEESRTPGSLGSPAETQKSPADRDLATEPISESPSDLPDRTL